MLLDIRLENVCWAALRVASTREGQDIMYNLEPGETMVITVDAISMGGAYWWYDLIISFPEVAPNLAKPVVLSGPKIHSIVPHTAQPSGHGFLYTP